MPGLVSSCLSDDDNADVYMHSDFLFLLYCVPSIVRLLRSSAPYTKQANEDRGTWAIKVLALIMKSSTKRQCVPSLTRWLMLMLILEHAELD